ncbi:hypothetical protein BH10ACT1_BH10ACT1_20470 [soil metagenome]
MAHPETESELAEGLGQLLGAEIEGLRRLSGGASRETWAFDAVDGPGEKRPLILQRIRPGLAMGGPSLATEDALLAAAAAAGVPVPPVVADGEAARPFVGEGRVTGHVDGEALGPRIVRSERYATARTRLAGQCGRALAAIHSIEPGAVPGLAPVDTLGRLRDGLDGLDEHRPAFELALRWLAANQPPAGSEGVVHGDFRIGNLLVDETGLRAVLDWELAHLGDPLEDLGWLCVRAWRFGGDGEVGGVAPLADLLDAYAEATGTPVDPEAVRWWIVAGTLTWGLICAVQARRHLDGHIRSVELATIGRRICETEYDLLQLLDVPAPTVVDEIPAPGVADLGRHGRPTAAELVDAVRGHLVDAVAPELTGAAAFHLKVAGNALAIVERELRLGPAMARADQARLDALGFADEPELAAAVRAGHLDGQAEVAAVIRAAVVDRVRVANPKWLEPPDRD